MPLFSVPFINLTPIVDTVEEAKRRNRIKLALVAVAVVALFLILRKK
jgi:hypothetical protein